MAKANRKMSKHEAMAAILDEEAATMHLREGGDGTIIVV